MTVHISAAVFVCAALAFEQVLSRFPTSALVRAFKHLGDISYSTYLVHLIALCIAVNLLEQPQSLFGEVFALGAYTAMTLILSQSQLPLD